MTVQKKKISELDEQASPSLTGYTIYDGNGTFKVSLNTLKLLFGFVSQTLSENVVINTDGNQVRITSGDDTLGTGSTYSRLAVTSNSATLTKKFPNDQNGDLSNATISAGQNAPYEPKISLSVTLSGITTTLSLTDTGISIDGRLYGFEYIEPTTDYGYVQKGYTNPDIITLTDGVSISGDCGNIPQQQFALTTSQTGITLTLKNFEKLADFSVKKTISGNTSVTIDGTNLKFIDMDNKSGPATSVSITLSDVVNSYFEISCKDSGITDGGSKVILVKSI